MRIVYTLVTMPATFEVEEGILGVVVDHSEHPDAPSGSQEPDPGPDESAPPEAGASLDAGGGAGHSDGRDNHATFS